MNQGLSAQLMDKFPLIFPSPNPHAGKAFLFECEDGWFDLIEALCNLIQQRVDDGRSEQVVARQVKEKQGQLRFYYVGASGDAHIEGIVAMASEMSFYVCEICGNRGQFRNDGRFFRTRCDEHNTKG